MVNRDEILTIEDLRAAVMELTAERDGETVVRVRWTYEYLLDVDVQPYEFGVVINQQAHTKEPEPNTLQAAYEALEEIEARV